MRELSTLSPEDMRTFINSIDTFLVDCDGVLWAGATAFPGSLEVINKLKEMGKKVFLVSNNSTRTVTGYIEKCRSFGCHVKKDEIIIPPVVIAEYLKSQGFKGKAFVIGSQAFKETLTELGIDIVSDEEEFEEETLEGFINYLSNLDPSIAAVILDFDLKLNYVKLVKALTLMRLGNAIYILGATDSDVPVGRGITILGPGYFGSILESAAKCKPIVAGKPGTIVADIISSKHPLVPERTIMIGDAMLQDILLGTNCGFQTLLVLSGVSTLEDALKDPSNRPDYYTNTLGDLLPLL